jgi:excisionase family DNA binding protein
LTGRPTARPFIGGEDEVPATSERELAMEQYLSNLSNPSNGPVEYAVVTPNVWLLSSAEIPPILFTTEEVARLLGIGKCRVYDLIRQRELRSVKVGASRRVSARALSDYVAQLEMEEPA